MQQQNSKLVNEKKGLVVFLDHHLGEGSFGKVYKGQIGFRTDKAKDSAVKIIQKSTCHETKISQERELIILKKINHSGIIKCYDYQASSNNYYLFMEFCDGPTLEQYINQNNIFEEKKVLEMTASIISALYYLTNFFYENDSKKFVAEGVAHRDLKPSNMMFTNNQLKLIDFGFIKPLQDDEVTLGIGTPLYMSIQNLQSQHYNPEKNDVWSMGVILYELLHGVYPWRCEVSSKDQLIAQLENLNLQFDQNISEPMRQLLSKMLQVDEHYRPDWSEVVHDPVYQGYLEEQVFQSWEMNSSFMHYEQIQKYMRQMNFVNSAELKQLTLQLHAIKVTKNLKSIQENSKLQKKIEQLYATQIEEQDFRVMYTESELRIRLQQELKKLKLQQLNEVEIDFINECEFYTQ